MAAISPSVTSKTAGGVIGKYTLICELGGRAPTTFAAYTSVLGELVILERLARSSLSAKEIETFTRTARRIALVTSPNFPRVRDVFVTSQLVAIASDFVEGETLAELNAPIEGKKRPELAVRLRILVDLLAGLEAIHTAPELENGKEVKAIVHGEVTPANVLVGLDGTTRIIRPYRVPRRGTVLPEHVKSLLGYVAPETLVGDGPDPRADLYAVGVMLWEAISGERLFAQTTPEAALTLQLAGDLPRAKLPDDGLWAEPLVNIAARALQVSPERRFPTAKDFADAIRRAVEPMLAPTLQVAAAVSARAGEKIEGRRLRLKPPPVAAASVPKVSAPRPVKSMPPTAVIAAPVVKAKVEQDLEIDWQDVVEAKAPPRSMPPPVPSRAPSRGPLRGASNAPPPVSVPPMIQAPLPTILSMEALVPPVPAPPLIETPSAEAVEAPDTTPVLASSDDTQPMRLRPPRNPRFAIVAGLVGLCVFILVAAGIRAAVTPKDGEPMAKKSDPVMPAVREAPAPTPPPIVEPPPPEPSPVVAIPPEVLPSPPVAKTPAPVVVREPRPPSAPAVAGKTPPRPVTPKAPKRPKSNYEPQGI